MRLVLICLRIPGYRRPEASAPQGEAVALRKSPVRAPAMLGANRANAQKSTGPSAASGKARAALNSLKHGAYAVPLPGTLLRAGDLQGAALYRWFRREIAATFKTGWSADERQAHGMAARAWCIARDTAAARHRTARAWGAAEETRRQGLWKRSRNVL